MELVYTVAKSHKYKRRGFVFRDEKPLISLSARNSLALCTTATLSAHKDEQYVDILNRGLRLRRLSLRPWLE